MPRKFKELRLFLGMDQKEMAGWFGTKQSVVSLWETGKRTPPLRDAAVKFGVSMDWLEGLSNRMWGERVVLLGRSYRRSLSMLTGERRRQLVEALPSERVMDVFRSLAQMAPDLVTTEYFARVIGVNPPSFPAILDREIALPEQTLKRLADFTGIPERWYASGDLLVLDASDLEEYVPLVQQMRAEGITPDDIQRIWNVIRSLRGS